jgi:hypothetical protein
MTIQEGSNSNRPMLNLGQRVQLERAVGETAVQVHRRGDDGGLRHQERA